MSVMEMVNTFPLQVGATLKDKDGLLYLYIGLNPKGSGGPRQTFIQSFPRNDEQPMFWTSSKRDTMVKKFPSLADVLPGKKVLACAKCGKAIAKYADCGRVDCGPFV